jgi:hypothetical protein
MNEDERKTVLDRIMRMSEDEVRVELQKIREVRDIVELRTPREFTFIVGAPDDGQWESLDKERTIETLQGVVFGLAEEVIGLVQYTDGTYRVGVGESLRPFYELYVGPSALEASSIFLRAILRHIDL